MNPVERNVLAVLVNRQLVAVADDGSLQWGARAQRLGLGSLPTVTGGGGASTMRLTGWRYPVPSTTQGGSARPPAAPLGAGLGAYARVMRAVTHPGQSHPDHMVGGGRFGLSAFGPGRTPTDHETGFHVGQAAAAIARGGIVTP